MSVVAVWMEGNSDTVLCTDEALWKNERDGFEIWEMTISISN